MPRLSTRVARIAVESPRAKCETLIMPAARTAADATAAVALYRPARPMVAHSIARAACAARVRNLSAAHAYAVQARPHVNPLTGRRINPQGVLGTMLRAAAHEVLHNRGGGALAVSRRERIRRDRSRQRASRSPARRAPASRSRSRSRSRSAERRAAPRRGRGRSRSRSAERRAAPRRSRDPVAAKRARIARARHINEVQAQGYVLMRD
jgi:hypothetical protein